MDIQPVNPWQWQTPLAFSQAIEVTNARRTLYCAGQTAMNADGVPMHAGDMRGQIELAMDNLEDVLSQAGYTLSDVVRLNYYTTDVDRFFAHYDAVTTRLGQAGRQPASTLLGVSRLAFPDLLVEIEATAMR